MSAMYNSIKPMDFNVDQVAMVLNQTYFAFIIKFIKKTLNQSQIFLSSDMVLINLIIIMIIVLNSTAGK